MRGGLRTCKGEARRMTRAEEKKGRNGRDGRCERDGTEGLGGCERMAGDGCGGGEDSGEVIWLFVLLAHVGASDSGA